MSVSYCGETLMKIGEYYRYDILGYISIPICCVGMIFNLLNMVVFTRKPVTSPNLIFAHLAFADFLMLLARVAYVWMWYIRDNSDLTFIRSYLWALFRRNNDTFFLTFQYLSIFLTVMLAVWRYIAIVHPLKERHWCNMKTTWIGVIACYILCLLMFAVPLYLSLEMMTRTYNGTTYYRVTVNEQRHILYSTANIISGLVFRLLPSIMFTVLTLRIVGTLLSRKSHREQLTSPANIGSNMKNVKMRQQMKKSTTILLIVLVLFILAEFPKGMLSLLQLVYEYQSAECYNSLIQIFFTVSDINSTITFVVHYSLSQQFRTTFKSLFHAIFFHRKQTPVALGDVEDDEMAKQTDEV